MRMGINRLGVSTNYTYPECVSVDGAWLLAEPDMEEDTACWVARLQLGPIIGPWACGCCREWAWGWCNAGCCCGCLSWALSCCWFIQEGPLWESVCGKNGKTGCVFLMWVDCLGSHVHYAHATHTSGGKRMARGPLMACCVLSVWVLWCVLQIPQLNGNGDQSPASE